MPAITPPNLHSLGSARGRGNLLGVEPYVTPRDYASAASFRDLLAGYLTHAQNAGWLNEKTIVVFPENIGTWLVLADESERVYQAPTLAAAERWLVLKHPVRYLAHWLTAQEAGRLEAAFFRMKARHMADIYHNVFSTLARDYQLTIVAGSIILPSPQISSRGLILSEGPLFNSSLIYQPDGTPHPHLIRKIFPITRELAFVAPASVAKIPVFDTPAGRLGALICADSWYPQAYAPLKEQGVTMLAVPSYSELGAAQWTRPWPGYDGVSAPAEVDAQDILTITEGQAWQKYALAGRIVLSGATHGINVFLRGKLWDLDLGGWSGTLVRAGEVFIEEPTRQAALLNVWL